MQLNPINCESTDSESDSDKAISINLIHIDNEYEPIKYEQPIHSHIYQNHDHFLLNYNTRPISSKKTIVNIVEEITEEKPTEFQAQITITKIYLKKRNKQKKNLDNSILLESPKCKELQKPDLETDLLIDSGADSNIINKPLGMQ